MNKRLLAALVVGVSVYDLDIIIDYSALELSEIS